MDVTDGCGGSTPGSSSQPPPVLAIEGKINEKMEGSAEVRMMNNKTDDKKKASADEMTQMMMIRTERNECFFLSSNECPNIFSTSHD